MQYQILVLHLHSEQRADGSAHDRTGYNNNNMKRYAIFSDGQRCYEFVTSSDYYFMQRVAQGARLMHANVEVKTI